MENKKAANSAGKYYVQLRPVVVVRKNARLRERVRIIYPLNQRPSFAIG